MREHPWHVRRVTHRNQHEHRNLLDLHYLTHAWVDQEKGEVQNPFELDPSLEDDTSPEDVILRLDHSVQEVQTLVIRSRIGRSDKGGASSAPLPLLDERSKAAGKECAQRRWNQDDPLSERPISPDKRALLIAMYHSPMAGRLGEKAFLVHRALTSQVSVELLQCPHTRPDLSSTPEVAHELCKQRFQWLKGYLEFIQPTASVELTRTGSRCVVHW